MLYSFGIFTAFQADYPSEKAIFIFSNDKVFIFHTPEGLVEISVPERGAQSDFLFFLIVFQFFQIVFSSERFLYFFFIMCQIDAKAFSTGREGV